MKIFETHAHYDDAAFDADRDALLEEMLSAEIETIVNVGASRAGCEASLELAGRYPAVYAAVGIHPEEIETLTMQDLDWLAQTALENPKVVAVGEIGLDYHYPEPGRQRQQEGFRQQLTIASSVKKPLIIHSREACADTLACMRHAHAEQTGGVLHCYSYTKEAVKEFLEMGFYIGIGGVVTFKNARKLVETVEVLPMDRILLETDCPYLAPEPNRGKRNDSRNLCDVAKKIAQIKGTTAQEVISRANENAHRLFFGKMPPEDGNNTRK